jgi:glucose/arabinose dehydrogenase
MSLQVFNVAVDGQTIDWPTLGFTPVVPNTFTEPVGITHAGDNSGRLFIVQQTGTISIVQNGNVMSQPFLNISSRVTIAGQEQGLLGLAFPPGFPTVNHFYVDYTIASNNSVVISRFQLSPTNGNVADPASEQRLLVIHKPYNNHNAGQLAFGPDGYLYIGVGDGGSEGDPLNYGQNTSVLLGKLLRIDVEGGVSPYAIPPSNPFVGNSNFAPEIWAYGLRNPWRFSFDRQTGDLYIGDVGQYLYEEVDFQPAGSAGGQNYGWRIMEGDSNYNVPAGFTNFASLTLPVTTYSHLLFLGPDGGNGAAIIGGYVYRGPSVTRMNGLYFYGDFVNGWIWGMAQNGGSWTNFALMSPPVTGFAPTNFYISTFGEDDQGALYFSDYYAGKIYKIQDTRAVWAPAFSPAGGIINSNQVVVACATPGATIHYTTNGANPTVSSPVIASGATLTVITGQTIKLIAFRSDLTTSPITTGIFTNQVGTPVFAPPAGPIPAATPVSISTVTPGATIYYTTNGTTPTTNSATYTGPITASGGSKIEAFGAAAGYSNSVVAVASYTATQVATPVFDPASGPITNGTPLTITCATPGSTIFFTLDGSSPTTNSPLYSGPIAINGGITVQAFAVESNYVNSAIQSTFFQLVQTATPVFSPPSGPITNGTFISMSCPTAGATIYYTLDGSAPTTNSTVYSNSVPINGGTTVNAYATASQHLDSTVTSVTYNLFQLGAPQFSPSQGPLTNGSFISIAVTNNSEQVYYTTDGSTPTTNSALYSGPILFTNLMTVQALAVATGFLPSPIQSVFYGLWDPIPNVAVTTVAGSPVAGFADGFGAKAHFSRPEGICMSPAGVLFVADDGNNCIREVLPSGQVITYAGNGKVLNSQDPSASNASFNLPVGVCFDAAGNLYVGDGGNCDRICKIGTNGSFSVYANVRQCGPGIGNFGAELGQLISDPAGNLYTGAWATVQKILTNGSVVGLAGTGCACPGGWSVSVGVGIDSATNLYAATAANVWVIPAGGGAVNSLTSDSFAFSDGPAASAGFANLTAAVVDASSNIYLSDSASIRKLSPSGWVSTVAGTSVPGYLDGPGNAAQFNGSYPLAFEGITHMGICLDTNGNLYVSDTANNCVRKISFNTVARPQLTIALSTNAVDVTWPAWSSNFILESSGTLGSGALWLPVTNGMNLSPGGTSFVWSNQPAGTATFFRLHQP